MEDLKENPTISDMQRHLVDFVKSRGWNNKTETEVFMLFVEEVGELAKALRKHISLQGEEPDKDNLEEEFADVLNFLLDLADKTDVDLEEAYRKKHSINKKRTWPGDK